jgi:hypothetical protein
MSTIERCGSSAGARGGLGGKWQGVLWLALLVSGGNLGCQSSKRPAAPLPPEGWLPGQAQVLTVQGSGCRGRNLGDSWHRLRAGDWLSAGADLEARAPSSLTLRLFDLGVTVQVKPGTLLHVDKICYRNDSGKLLTSTVFTLQQGEVAVDRANLTPGSEFEIRTPQGVSRLPPQPST